MGEDGRGGLKKEAPAVEGRRAPPEATPEIWQRDFRVAPFHDLIIGMLKRLWPPHKSKTPGSDDHPGVSTHWGVSSDGGPTGRELAADGSRCFGRRGEQTQCLARISLQKLSCTEDRVPMTSWYRTELRDPRAACHGQAPMVSQAVLGLRQHDASYDWLAIEELSGHPNFPRD